MDPRSLPRDAQRRVHRAVLFGERLSNPRERRAAVAAARRRRERPLRMALPMLAATLATLAVTWGLARLYRPAWTGDLLAGGGLAGAGVGVVLGCAILVVLQRYMAGRAQALNSDSRRRGAQRRRR